MKVSNSGSGGSDTRYTLNLSAASTGLTDGAGNESSQSRNIGALVGTVSLKDFVGNADLFDFYKFTLTTTTDFKAFLTGRTQSAGIDLYLDKNRNGKIDSDESSSIVGDYGSGSSNASITRTLGAGDYFVRVSNSGAGGSDTLYTLELTGPPGSPTPQPPPQTGGAGGPVYRFFDSLTGTHFYTANATEASARSADPRYRNEGGAFDSRGPNSVERFVNTQTGAYFYTINPVERDQVIRTLPQFQFQPGQVFNASATQQAGYVPVYRFFNIAGGVHFYTVNAAEADNVRRTLPGFRDEGVAYYADPLG